jgi:hypothetical protein
MRRDIENRNSDVLKKGSTAVVKDKRCGLALHGSAYVTRVPYEAFDVYLSEVL